MVVMVPVGGAGGGRAGSGPSIELVPGGGREDATTAAAYKREKMSVGMESPRPRSIWGTNSSFNVLLA